MIAPAFEIWVGLVAHFVANQGAGGYQQAVIDPARKAVGAERAMKSTWENAR